MLLLELINTTLLEKIKKFHNKFKLKISLFSIISINPRLSEEQAFNLTNIISIIELNSGQLPLIKKISFKASSNDIKIIVCSSNIKSSFILKFFLFFHAFNYLQDILNNLFLRSTVVPIKKKLLIKLQNATVLSNFFGHLDKYHNINTQLNIYAFVEINGFINSKYFRSIF